MRRGVLVLAVAVAVTGVAAPIPGGEARAADGPVTRASVTSDGSEVESPSGAPDMSADGRYVAFQSLGDLGEPSPTPSPSPTGGLGWQVYLRDLDQGRTTAVSDPAAGDATAPTVSGDGRLVAYVRTTSFGDDNDVMVADRGAGGDGETALHQVTGTPSDLRYQRIRQCRPPVSESASPDWPCRPQLSDDGTALAFPALLSPIPSGLTVWVGAPDANPTPDTGDVVDFGDYIQPGDESERIVQVRNQGFEPIDLTGVGLAGEGFTIDDSTCDDFTVDPGESCTVDLVFAPTAANCPIDGTFHELQGMLTTQAPTPDGRAAFPLVGDCAVFGGRVAGSTPAGSTAAAPARTVASCGPVDLTGLTPEQVTPEPTDEGHWVTDLGNVQTGQRRLVAMPGQVQEFTEWFAAPQDCSVLLVQPPPDQQLVDQPPPCQESNEGGCTVYVLFQPDAVRRSVGTLIAGSGVYRFTGTGERDVVIERRDPSGTGDFAGPGRPPARVVSLDDGDDRMNGTQPSISGDGRYVAFTSTGPAGRTQVYVRDTERGRTVRASRLPPGTPAATADEPSISADGRRVAFSTRGISRGGSEVYLRDLDTGTSVLVSRPASAADDGWASSAPALSSDGTTVVFASSPPSEGFVPPEIHARYVVPDLTGSAGAVTEVLASAGDEPTTDAYGRHTAFQTFDPLVPDDTNGSIDAYVYERAPRVTVRPGTLDFRVVQVGTTSPPLPVTLVNEGPGPAVLTDTTVRGPFRVRSDGCAGQVLHRGEQCLIELVYAPTATKQQGGELTVGTRFTEPGAPYLATLVGDGVSAPAQPGPSPTPSGGPSPPTAAKPTLLLDRPLSPPGRATMATGAGFPARTRVTLTWKPGLGRVTVRADAAGRFSVSVPILVHDRLGKRVLLATYPDDTVLVGGAGSVRSKPFLVVPAPGQPPGFHDRA